MGVKKDVLISALFDVQHEIKVTSVYEAKEPDTEEAPVEESGDIKSALSKILKVIKSDDKLTDKLLHDIAEEEGVKPNKLEVEVYKVLRKFLKGKQPQIESKQVIKEDATPNEQKVYDTAKQADIPSTSIYVEENKSTGVVEITANLQLSQASSTKITLLQVHKLIKGLRTVFGMPNVTIVKEDPSEYKIEVKTK